MTRPKTCVQYPSITGGLITRPYGFDEMFGVDFRAVIDGTWRAVNDRPYSVVGG